MGCRGDLNLVGFRRRGALARRVPAGTLALRGVPSVLQECLVGAQFGDSLRSKTDDAMVNETLCKVLCHNLVVLIHKMCELGIDPVFWKPTTIQ